MPITIDLFKTEENQYVTRVAEAAVLAPVVGAVGLYLIGDNFDVPLLTGNGYKVNGADSENFRYAQYPTDAAGHWQAKMDPKFTLKTPYVSREVVSTPHITDADAVTQAIVPFAKKTVDTSPGGKIDINAYLYNPATSLIRDFGFVTDTTQGKTGISSTLTYHVSFGEVGKTENDEALNSKISEAFSNSSVWQGNTAPSLFVSQLGEMDVPYTYSQYKAMFDLAQSQGYTSIGMLSSEIASGKHEDLRPKAEAILRGPGQALHDPGVFLLASKEDVMVNTSTQPVCTVLATTADARYQVLSAEQHVNPIEMTGLTLITSIALMAMTVRKRRRSAGGMEVPPRAMREAVADGSASGLDKLQVLAYKQALAREGSIERHSVRSILRGALRPIGIAALLSLAAGGIASRQSDADHSPSIVPVKHVNTTQDCPPDAQVVTVFDGKVHTEENNYIGQLPQIIRDLPKGK